LKPPAATVSDAVSSDEATEVRNALFIIQSYMGLRHTLKVRKAAGGAQIHNQGADNLSANEPQVFLSLQVVCNFLNF
jgi:hypothetical protein